MAGRTWKFGNDVDTDAIIPGRFIANWNKDPEKLKNYCFADMRPEFAKEVRTGDIVVAGKNFGCGSSREAAPVSIKMTGVRILIAETYARIFYRNCINVGLLALESAEAVCGLEDANKIEVDTEKGVIRNITKGESYLFKPVPPFLQEILNIGGLAPYIQKRLGIT